MGNTRIWFTSDHHFAHANIIKYCNRSFDTVQEMDTKLISLWNSVVGDEYIVYYVGDFTLGNIHYFKKCIMELNGQVKILPGSHDYRWLAEFHPKYTSRSGLPVKLLPPLISLEFPELGDGKHPQVIVLCHYAMRVWDRSHHGAWHLYGHSHGSLPGQGLSFDVGVDCNEFKPISLEQVAERMAVIKPVISADQTPL